MAVDRTSLSELIDVNEQAILTEWLKLLKKGVGTSGGRIKDGELQAQCRDFLAALREALSSGVEGSKPNPISAFESCSRMFRVRVRFRVSVPVKPRRSCFRSSSHCLNGCALPMLVTDS